MGWGVGGGGIPGMLPWCVFPMCLVLPPLPHPTPSVFTFESLGDGLLIRNMVASGGESGISLPHLYTHTALPLKRALTPASPTWPTLGTDAPQLYPLHIQTAALPSRCHHIPVQ